MARRGDGIGLAELFTPGIGDKCLTEQVNHLFGRLDPELGLALVHRRGG